MSRIVLGVGGGIAAYKVAALLRRFTETGHDVTVVPTAAALRFVGAPTWSALSGKPVTPDVFDDVHEVRHVRLGQQADLVVVAPATADLLAKAAHGLADDLLTNVLLTAHSGVVLAPAMHTEMWQHPATVANVATLRARGVRVIEPSSGRLTGVDTGPGRMPEPEEIHAVCLEVLGAQARAARATPTPPLTPTPTPAEGADGSAGPEAVQGPVGSVGTVDSVESGSTGEPGEPGESVAQSVAALAASGPALYAVPESGLAGRRVVVSAGGTREALDPVRFLGNRSSGKQGYALARTAAARGARVTLVAANVELPDLGGVDIVRVESALDLQREVDARFDGADVIVMAAAVADFRPASYEEAKIKKSHDAGHEDDAPIIHLVRNPDILAGLVARRREEGTDSPLIVGFAAETGDAEGDVLHHARRKLAHKGCDLLAANEVGRDVTFGKDESTVHLLRADDPGDPVTVGPASKDVLADGVWDAVEGLLSR
ncbi:bifunctional phosphopantothenoylcysteine decarboxylase/phosphopantothenate synthase [Piscicoccus intestinalis]|uniref:bifunctional phosphopantothenoylcysteine decarboxylase/phosphopantothenate synthase n=1 Tax=Piscicoccus intestinalis TaxID=746033 RepID=UPI000837E1E9|nr:bifunctional phosphopantothenoylcysteine decarboxylase/phosphopantothenate synthase [Piscicoccus intestinalis]